MERPPRSGPMLRHWSEAKIAGSYVAAPARAQLDTASAKYRFRIFA
jgi:hypothetical protein